MIRRALTAALLAAATVLAVAGPAAAKPSQDDFDRGNCAPGWHLVVSHCEPLIGGPGRHAI